MSKPKLTDQSYTIRFYRDYPLWETEKLYYYYVLENEEGDEVSIGWSHQSYADAFSLELEGVE